MSIRTFNEESERAEAILNDYAQDVEGIEPSQELVRIADEIIELESQADKIERELDDLADEAREECQLIVANRKREAEVGACPICGYLNCVIPQHQKEPTE